jgi:glycosyltransferase involved in cell wall biosynthesis
VKASSLGGNFGDVRPNRPFRVSGSVRWYDFRRRAKGSNTTKVEVTLIWGGRAFLSVTTSPSAAGRVMVISVSRLEPHSIESSTGVIEPLPICVSSGSDAGALESSPVLGAPGPVVTSRDSGLAVASHGTSARVLITVPVRNEATRLLSTLESIDGTFRRSGLEYSLSVAEDGSTDGTKDLLHELPRRWPGILIQEDDDPLGRGRALRRLWGVTAADVYCFTDADLAAGPEALLTAVRGVLSGSPIVVGSRYTYGSRTTRPPVRSLVSQTYNWILRASFREEIRDHQCGLKAFSGSVIRELLHRTQEDSWFWDSEILILGLENGYSVTEIPVSWVERKMSRTAYRRLLSDAVLHGGGILRLKSRVRVLESGRPAERSILSKIGSSVVAPVGGVLAKTETPGVSGTAAPVESGLLPYGRERGDSSVVRSGRS